jgi:hypothetical protein
MISRPNRMSVVLICLLAITHWTRATEPPANEKPRKFLRFVDDNEGGGKLDAAIVTYKNSAGVQVHLVSAVHVGEKKYYDELQKNFSKYDALLYEMVKPRDATPPTPGQRSESTVSGVQRILKDVLELEFQLDAIDYSAKNFVHADLDAETFTKLQEERGENLFTLMLKAMLSEMAKPSAAPEVSLTELVVALLSPDSARHFKLILARQFEDIEAKVAGFEGPNGSVLVTERNKAALAILKKTIDAGKKEIGIFYGAAHMGDIEKRLEEMGIKYEKSEWLTAWDMTPKEGDVVIKTVKKKPEPAKQP